MSDNKYAYSKHYHELTAKINETYQHLPDQLAGTQDKAMMAKCCEISDLVKINAGVNHACNNTPQVPYKRKLTAYAQIAILQRLVEDCVRDIMSDIFIKLNQNLMRTVNDVTLIDEITVIQTKIEKTDVKETQHMLNTLKTRLANMGQDTCNDLHIYTDIEYCLDAVQKITGRV